MTDSLRFRDLALIKARGLRTRIVWRIRSTFRLYKNEARDRLIDGAMRDNEKLSAALLRQAVLVNALYDRLDWYERAVPALKKARSAYEADRRKKRRKAEKAAAALAKRADELAESEDPKAAGFDEDSDE